MKEWSPDYHATISRRNKLLIDYEKNPQIVKAAKIYYAANPIEWICTWVNTYDPRNSQADGIPPTMPLTLFPIQREFVEFVYALIDGKESGLVAKSRDMGATWVACAISVHLFLFRSGVSVGWGSRKEVLIDQLGSLDSIFEKIRMIFRGVPKMFLPDGFNEKSMSYMKIIGSSGATITGEAGTNIGRGGRSTVYFLDEAAFIERPESVEAALSANTNTQIMISSVNGLGNLFHRKYETGVTWDGEIHPGRTHVFDMPWDSNPLKDQKWYDLRRKKAMDEGMLHVFESEVNANFSASVEGVLIPGEWVKSAIDAHIKLDFEDDGGYVAGLDIADEGRDTNAQALRKGVVLKSIDEWVERDTGATARKSIDLLTGKTVSVQYDCIGVGSGVKSEINRLGDEDLLPAGIKYVPWNAAAGTEQPDAYVVEDDPESPTNKDFYTNLKAQAGWQLRLRFERTHKAVTEQVAYNSDDLISLDSTMPLIRKLQKELSQSTVGKGVKLKLLINKTPEGTKSPNLADAVAMCYFPLNTGDLEHFEPRDIGIYL